MIDIENIPTDTEVTVKLPRLVVVWDYHDFEHLKSDCSDQLGITVAVDEVGFYDGQYYGLMHTDTVAHQQLAEGLRAYFDNLNDQ